jgi:4-hydroxy-tetrahydrodipicolinate synthase
MRESSLHAKLRGIVPPVVTPLGPDGRLDEVSLVRLIDHLIAAGVHGLFLLGSSGEVAYLDSATRSRVLQVAVRAANGRVPILSGAVDLTAARVIEQVRAAEEAGVDAVVVTPPIYALNDASEIEEHFRVIAAATPLPVFAYDIPARVRTKLDGPMLVRLGQDGVLSGVKDSSGDDVAFRHLVHQNVESGSPLAILTGHEVVVDGMLLLGADGAVPGLANVDAAGYVRLWDAALVRDWEAVSLEQSRLAALFDIVRVASTSSPDARGIGAFKVAMRELGLIDHAAMAAPVRELDADASRRVVEVLRNADLLTDA